MPSPAVERFTRIALDLGRLTKPRITFASVLMSGGGMLLAASPMEGPRVLASLIGVGLAVGAANALNMWMERDTDALMARTSRRPLPAKSIDPKLALRFALVLGVLGVGLLAFCANALAAIFCALALVSYVWVYTPLKRRTALAMPVGAIPGALPPLIGYVAATNRIDGTAVALVLLLYLWQIPHFMAIALAFENDYGRAGIKTWPTEFGHRSARWQAALHATGLVPMGFVLWWLDLVGGATAVAVSGLGAALSTLSIAALLASRGRPWDRRVFLGTLAYLPLFTLVLGVDRWLR